MDLFTPTTTTTTRKCAAPTTQSVFSRAAASGARLRSRTNRTCLNRSLPGGRSGRGPQGGGLVQAHELSNAHPPDTQAVLQKACVVGRCTTHRQVAQGPSPAPARPSCPPHPPHPILPRPRPTPTAPSHGTPHFTLAVGTIATTPRPVSRRIDSAASGRTHFPVPKRGPPLSVPPSAAQTSAAINTPPPPRACDPPLLVPHPVHRVRACQAHAESWPAHNSHFHGTPPPQGHGKPPPLATTAFPLSAQHMAREGAPPHKRDRAAPHVRARTASVCWAPSPGTRRESPPPPPPPSERKDIAARALPHRGLGSGAGQARRAHR